MDLKRAKITAFLLDRAITLNPAEIETANRENPSFLGGPNWFNFAEWSRDDIAYISRLFWNWSEPKRLVHGYQGVGIEKNDHGDYTLVISADAVTFREFLKAANYIDQKTELPVVCHQVENAQFATLPSSKYRCSGGACIVSPGSGKKGVLGAWLQEQSGLLPPTVGITNNHVAAEFNKFGIGTIISDDKGVDVGEISYIQRLHKWNPNNRRYNKVDLALIKPIQKSIIDYSVNGYKSGPSHCVDLEQIFNGQNPSPPGNNIKLCKSVGFSENGRILGMQLYCHVLDDNLNKFMFEDSVRIDTGALGDSGSLVLDTNGGVGGIFFALRFNRSTKRFEGLVNKFDHVISATNANFVF